MIMQRTRALLLSALASTFLIAGCGDDGNDEAKQQLEAERQKLEEQKADIREIRQLQAKEKDGTITQTEKNHLDFLYSQLEAQGQQ